jgi:hypothetical protein
MRKIVNRETEIVICDGCKEEVKNMVQVTYSFIVKDVPHLFNISLNQKINFTNVIATKKKKCVADGTKKHFDYTNGSVRKLND